MEPKLVRKDIKYQKKILVMVSILVISLFMGGSFALLSSSSETEEVVTFKTGELNMKVATTGTLSLDGEVPKNYDDGFKSNDIIITLTNIGTLEIGKYEVKLEGDSSTTLENKYIRYSISEDDGKTYLVAKLLNDDNIIYTGYNLKDTKVLKLKIWIDEDAGEVALKKIYNGKINAELYQKGDSDTAVQVVKSKLVSNYSGSNESFPGGLVAVNMDGNLYHEVNNEEIREYRYSGPTVNNYVTFNNELWRIIGVFKDENNIEHVKLVKGTFLYKEILPNEYVINNTVYNINYIYNDSIPSSTYFNKTANYNNDWTTAGLQYYLNTFNDDSNTPNYGYLHYLSTESLNMIEDTTYYLGNFSLDTIPNIYKNERASILCGSEVISNTNENNCNIWYGNKPTWVGKIGLLYPSDIGYSVNSMYWDVISINLNNTSVINNSWIEANGDNNWAWLMSPASTQKDREAFYNVPKKVFFSVGDFVNGNTNNTSHNRAIPVLYLKNNVKVVDGNGTKDNPYNLILK